MSKVSFWALINNTFEVTSAPRESSLLEWFRTLREDPDMVDLGIPSALSYKKCTFYRLNNPVSVSALFDPSRQNDSATVDRIKDECWGESNAESVDPLGTRVGRLSEDFLREYVYLVVSFPPSFADSIQAFQTLQAQYQGLFKSLRVEVATASQNSWTVQDVRNNLAGGTITEEIGDLPAGFKRLQDALETKRVFSTKDGRTKEHKIAWSFKAKFQRMFRSAANSRGSEQLLHRQEFAAFYHVVQRFQRDARKIKDHNSSALKASNFAVYFIQPPFLSEDSNFSHLEYTVEGKWACPIFVETSRPRTLHKYTPISDCMVASREHHLPLVICEVISHKQQSDRTRMLVQAIALARMGQYLLSSSANSFFIVAIYVDANMVASRYIVMHAGSADKVSIHRKDFALTNSNVAVDFLREMYNLAGEMANIAQQLDRGKQSEVMRMKRVAGKLLSLSSKDQKPKTVNTTLMETVLEGDYEVQELGDESDPNEGS